MEERQYHFEGGFEIRTHPKYPEEFFVVRNGRGIGGEGMKTSQLTYEQALRFVQHRLNMAKKNPPSFTRERRVE